MSEETVLPDTQQPDEELDLELEPETTPPADDVETLKARNAELEQKNKQLFARLKKMQQQPAQPPQSPKPKEDIGDSGTRLSRLELAEAKRQYAWEHGLSPEETDAVFAHTPKPTKETLQNPFVKGGLEAIRAERRVKEATPSPSGRSTTYKGKTFAEMNADERREFMANRTKG